MSIVARCRSCDARILWMKTDRGKNMPVDWDEHSVGKERFNPKTMTSHFATCPNADTHRKRS